MIYAVYRVLYGEDFIQESVLSIEPYVDKVLIYYTNRPFGNLKQCTYRGSNLEVLPKIDFILNKILDLNSDKVILQHHFSENPHNQFTTIVNTQLLPHYKKPDTLIFMEPDHVWRADQIEQALKEFSDSQLNCASSGQVELWKTPQYRIPERPNRVGSVFWNLKNLEKLPDTRPNGIGEGFQFLQAFVHNFGFCFSSHTMFWKHVLAINFSKLIGDSEPNEEWYDKIWMQWDLKTNNSNLEMARGFEHTIPHALEYDIKELPQTIIDKYRYDKTF